MWEMINKHINIKEYYIWDPCCGTGNLFRDANNKVFDFIDKDRLFLSDIDLTSIEICKKVPEFNPDNVFPLDYQNTIIDDFDNEDSPKMFVDEHCFQYNYQNTILRHAELVSAYIIDPETSSG